MHPDYKDAFEVLVKACRPLAYVAVRAKKLRKGSHY